MNAVNVDSLSPPFDGIQANPFMRFVAAINNTQCQCEPVNQFKVRTCFLKTVLGLLARFSNICGNMNNLLNY